MSLRGESIGVYLGALGDEYAALLQRSTLPVDRFTLTGVARSLLAGTLLVLLVPLEWIPVRRFAQCR